MSKAKQTAQLETFASRIPSITAPAAEMKN
jgi:hypothetical protein